MGKLLPLKGGDAYGAIPARSTGPSCGWGSGRTHLNFVEAKMSTAHKIMTCER